MVRICLHFRVFHRLLTLLRRFPIYNYLAYMQVTSTHSIKEIYWFTLNSTCIVSRKLTLLSVIYRCTQRCKRISLYYSFYMITTFKSRSSYSKHSHNTAMPTLHKYINFAVYSFISAPDILCLLRNNACNCAIVHDGEASFFISSVTFSFKNFSTFCISTFPFFRLALFGADCV